MVYSQYSVEDEISNFFAKTSACRSDCDARAEELVGGRATAVDVQGNCSYSVYAGPYLEYLVQFRLKSLQLDLKTVSLARHVYGCYAPTVSFEGHVGDESKEEEPLYVYVMNRIKGMTHLDFILAHDSPDNSPENLARRKRLMIDVARFFALAWKAPQLVNQTYFTKVRETLERELRMLLEALPGRLHHIIRRCIDSLDAILSLLMVLLHKDFGTCNIIVNEITCHLAGVIDWAEAEICPFGMNLHSLQSLTGKLHLRDGWVRYDDYDSLHDVFWTTFLDQVGGLTDECIETIRLARITGLLLSKGFTSRLASEPEPVPIGDDERGRYNMLSLDGFLLNPATKFEGID
ncbi:Protein kinase-like domain protein [Metarhizium rileyi]|uniref:Protein kinase-like domain protein n=1 Tax=Metarhizium rileyi (strain RCEF 4871) TaxID=1649241 RepID=A0A166WIJ4_METRR|nr:Protein kinase-like domain protein [Metarhizium rileyi RCEF 4871]